MAVLSRQGKEKVYSFLWQYLQLSEDQILQACLVKSGKKYPVDISKNELEKDVIHLKAIHISNFGNESLDPLKLLNTIRKFKLGEFFCNVCTALKMSGHCLFASAERSLVS